MISRILGDDWYEFVGRIVRDPLNFSYEERRDAARRLYLLGYIRREIENFTLLGRTSVARVIRGLREEIWEPPRYRVRVDGRFLPWSRGRPYSLGLFEVVVAEFFTRFLPVGVMSRFYGVSSPLASRMIGEFRSGRFDEAFRLYSCVYDADPRVLFVDAACRVTGKLPNAFSRDDFFEHGVAVYLDFMKDVRWRRRRVFTRRPSDFLRLLIRANMRPLS